MKWSFPHFMHHGVLCSMASFKAHCAFGFWKASLVLDGPGTATRWATSAASRRSGPAAQARADGYVKKAAKLNEDGVSAPRTRKAKAPAAVKLPADLAAALNANPRHATLRRVQPESQARVRGVDHRGEGQARGSAPRPAIEDGRGQDAELEVHETAGCEKRAFVRIPTVLGVG